MLPVCCSATQWVMFVELLEKVQTDEGYVYGQAVTFQVFMSHELICHFVVSTSKKVSESRVWNSLSSYCLPRGFTSFL